MLFRKMCSVKGYQVFVLVFTTLICFGAFTNTGDIFFPDWITTSQNTLYTINEDSITLKNNRDEYPYLRDDSITDNSTTLKKRLPSCLIIGTKKSGTRALCEFLSIHPKIQTACGEQHFFDEDFNYKKGLEFYRGNMPESYPDEITLEKSPRYFISERAPKRIHAFNSDIKLIVILRHPVKRMISDFWHERRSKRNIGTSLLKLEDLAFDNETGTVRRDYKAVDVSLYYIHIQHYLDYFSRPQLHVVDGDNFIKNPIEELTQVETFLGLNHSITKHDLHFNKRKGFFCYRKNGEDLCLKEGKGNKHPLLQEKYFKKLSDFFEPYNINLFKLLGKEFSWL